MFELFTPAILKVTVYNQSNVYAYVCTRIYLILFCAHKFNLVYFDKFQKRKNVLYLNMFIIRIVYSYTFTHKFIVFFLTTGKRKSTVKFK